MSFTDIEVITEKTTENYLLLLKCCIYADAKHEMMEYIKDTGILSQLKGNLKDLETTLLASPCNNSISRNNNYIINEVIFQYISDTIRNL